MTMKKIFKIALFATMLTGFTSCDDWLSLTSTNNLNSEIVWKDDSSVDLYVNGFYTYIHKYGQFGSLQFQNNLTESLTDTYKYNSYALGHKAGHPNNYVFNPSVITSSNCFYDCWGDAYEQIRRINQFMNDLSKFSSFSAEKNKMWEAQARFFRGFIYFQLAKRHGGVIIYKNLADLRKDVERSSAEDTWNFIDEDLTFAADNLPEEWASAGDKNRITKYAALAIKSRAMLYAGKWQAAYDAADAVIKSGKFELMANYKDACLGSNKESILEFKYANPNPSHSFDRDNAPLSDDIGTGGGYGVPTQEMVECYEKADGTKFDWNTYHKAVNTKPDYESLEPRFKATIIYPGAIWKGKVMDNSVNGKNGTFMAYRSQPYVWGYTTTGYYLRKLMNEKQLDVKSTPSTQTWVEIRFAEVLLNKAEAAFRLGKGGEAQVEMNKVRSRVNLPAKVSSGNEWFKDYRNERKVELAYEGQLFWDMRRWKLAHIEYHNYRCHGYKITDDKYEYIDVDYQDRKFLEKTYVLPVPDDELKNNTLITQYPEWSK